MMYSAYCKILGVNPNSSLEDVKRAYRQKAKLLHPDINSSPDAHTEFIRTKQAFEFIQRNMTCQALYRKRVSCYRERTRARPQYRSYYRYENAILVEKMEVEEVSAYNREGQSEKLLPGFNKEAENIKNLINEMIHIIKDTAVRPSEMIKPLRMLFSERFLNISEKIWQQIDQFVDTMRQFEC